MQSCVERYLELCGAKYNKALQKVETPFLDEAKPEFDENPFNHEFDLIFCRHNLESLVTLPP